AGADVTLVTGPVALPDPDGVKTIHVETAQEMLNACGQAMPADIAVCAAAVSDWRTEKTADQKIKKGQDKNPPTLSLVENPDILQTIATCPKNRPSLVIGFAAETENLIENAKAKLAKKSCDWIVANNVAEGVFGTEENHVTLVTQSQVQEWPRGSKEAIARDLVQEIINHYKNNKLAEAAE
ncbi:MAG TPA: phosphopantothenoylcysteine decarboxylase, partial [Alphaproteobacteria bacterium]|nr:phosphopantothenoylcysteine decarboxylase [Alphaproteobacteria bacterium]